MKTSRSLLIWATLALCGVMVLAAMTWLTRGVLASEKERTIAEARADLEERTRLALWRMDAVGAAIMLRENRYPSIDFVGSDFEYKKQPPEVLLHFDIRKGQQPHTPEFGSLMEGSLSTVDAVFPERRTQVKRLREFLAANPLPGDEWTLLNNAALEGDVAWAAQSKDAPVEQGYNKLQRENNKPEELRKDGTYQANSNTTERAQRVKAVAQSVDNVTIPQTDQIAATPGQQAQMAEQPVNLQIWSQGEVGQMRAVWVSGELFLLRRVTWKVGAPADKVPKEKGMSVQGVWLNSQNLKEQLLREVADLLPNAKLLAVEGKRAAEDPLAMVSFPFRLERNETSPAPSATISGPLLVGWIAVLLALLTASLLVHGVMRLSERRASFVSAVTHELRTPLTTFRLYSDMLETGAVKPEKRGDYLRVLSREADRLSHLVENVLAFSKIERGSARASVRELAVADLLAPMRERLEARLATAGLALEMDLETPAAATLVKVDSAAVEHILFNLIDNAAKYASSGDPPLVEIHANAGPDGVEILVTDHGPGIPPAERGRIFRAFHKSAREAAESKPGVGLGLALSRRLAREQGGELECGGSERGACFVLRLPRV